MPDLPLLWPSWILSRVKDQREFAIRDALARLTPPILLYAPVRIMRHRAGRRRVLVEQRLPALRPYAFVRIEAADVFHRVFHSGSGGRIHPVVIDKRPALVQPATIAAVRAIEAAGGFDDPGAVYSVAFRAGEVVLVVSGALNSRGVVLVDSRPRKKVKVGFASGLHGSFEPEALARLDDDKAAPARGRASQPLRAWFA
jgi:hypothetical protein